MKKIHKKHKRVDWKKLLVVIAAIKAITSMITEIIKVIKSL